MKIGIKTHHTLAVLAISLISFIGLESLVYINNLYLPELYIKVSGFIYLILLLWLYFIFDLHVKESHEGAHTIMGGLWKRFRHFASWKHFRQFQNYLILPGLIYWSSVVLIAINFRRVYLEHFVAIVSSIALVICYSFFKERFRHNYKFNNLHFVILAYVKLYASWLLYAAALGIVWYYCYPPLFYHLMIFISTFMLLYQALFQYHQRNFRHIVEIFLISIALSAASIFVYRFWNVNYFTAALLMTAVYNLLWTLMYHSMNRSLTRHIIFEQAAIFILVSVMIFGSTNFSAQIERCVF